MTLFDKFFNGEGKSQYDQTGFDATVNLDVHSQIGTAQAQLALINETTTVNEPSVSCTEPAGITYFFSTTSGKRWKRTAAGVYSALSDNANTGGHLSCLYYNGSVYYAVAGYLGKMVVSGETFSDTFGTFTNADALYHPMAIQNLTLYIGDGKYVASVNAVGTFSGNALDLETQHRITVLEPYENDLLVCTIVSSYINTAGIFRWDTYSSSWTVEDYVDEVGINAVFRADNVRFFQCGTSGAVYAYTGSKLEIFGYIRGVTTGVADNKTATLNGKPLLAIGSSIYSLYRKDSDLTYAFVNEYTASGTITSLNSFSGQLLVCVAAAVQKIDTNRATATVTTPIYEGKIKSIRVPYESLNGGTLALETNVNGAGYVSETGFINDAINYQYILQSGPTYLGQTAFSKCRVTITPSGAITPVIKGIYID